jgi:hypothetical protein
VPPRPVFLATSTATVVLAALAGAGALRTQLAALGDVEAGVRREPVAEGMLVKATIGEDGTRFLAFVRERVPEHEAFVLHLPEHHAPGPVCGSAFREGDFRWVAYQLLPRPVTCGPARWHVYLGVEPEPLPAGDVAAFGPGLLVVRVP